MYPFKTLFQICIRGINGFFVEYMGYNKWDISGINFAPEPSFFNVKEAQKGQTHMGSEEKNPEKTLSVQPNPPFHTWVAWGKPFPDRKQWKKVF